MNQNPFDKLKELSDRILSGEVVFFIGAGFSIDSEKNSAKHLMKRLIMRFDAVTFILTKAKPGDLTDGRIRCDNIIKIARELRQALTATFDLPQKKNLCSKKNIEALSKSYYQVNEWICSAYSVLLDQLKDFKDEKKARLCKKINRREKHLRERINDDKTPDKASLKKKELDNYTALNFYPAGKAFFLDTMGFDNSDIMGGSPFERDIDAVLKSYQRRLLKRHHVLARLAREGLSNPLITTNYDLLLEGAYRLAGFMPRRIISREKDEKETGSKVLYPYFDCIADPGHFFNYGYAHRTSVIAKIHGCVDIYRSAKKNKCNCPAKNDRDPGKPVNDTGDNDWERYLSSMVFTFREIQNWREDAWSRDYVRTLLRTRTIVFCGYSGADPVLHDTFRSVYEEMEKQRKRCVPIPGDNGQKFKIPAFFFGSSRKKGFHAMEILRAASKAVEKDTHEITNHENYLRFNINKKEDKETGNEKFPNLDELMLWLYHLTCREIQRRCLENNLHQISMHLLGQTRPLRELEIIKKEFRLLLDKEKNQAAGWDENPRNRGALYRVTNWSEYFHTGLLKVYSSAEDQVSVQGVRGKTGDKSSPSWYYPFTEKPGWTAWAVVVEIALRKMISQWQECFENWNKDKYLLEIISTVTPAVCYSPTNHPKTPILLEFKCRGADSVKFSFQLPGAFSKKRTWYLSQKVIPWIKEDCHGIPGAKTLWKWALKTTEYAGDIGKDDIARLEDYFGKKI